MKTLLENISKHYNETQTNEIKKILNFVNNIKNEHKIYNFSFSEGVVNILLHVMVDYNTVIAGIIYPYLKHNKEANQFLEQIKALVNEETFKMLDALMKIEQLKTSTHEAQAKNIKDMFIALAKDIRVIILKLAIELEKTEKLELYIKQDQAFIISSIEEIFAPLAAMLGIGYIKNGLEKAVFKYTKPVQFTELSNELNNYVEERNNQIQLSVEKIKKELEQTNIHFEISGRQKQICSIYKKMQFKNKSLNQVLDILAIRILVDTVDECYFVLGKIHSIYKPIGHFKDYISQPKENGYQSLHTTVTVENGDPLEIQIRTRDMHLYAEYGFAAHWAYKEHRKINDSDQKLSYIRSVMELYKDKTSEELLEALKTDVYSGNIFVQTPMGKILQFPEGATPIDFAYAIHSKIGDSCVGAKINDKMVPLSTPMKNGDIVSIITNANAKGPSRDWIKLAKTASARSKINYFFKKEMKEENIKKGKSMLESTAKAKALPLNKLMVDKYLEKVFEKNSFLSLDDMYASIGYGGVTASQILNKLYNLYRDEQETNKPTSAQEYVKTVNNISTKNINNNVDVLGYSNIFTKFAHCCNPLPGDEIVGYISRGKGVTIHRCNCDAIKNYEPERLIECTWNLDNSDTFIGAITILCKNSQNSIALITKAISDMKINIVGLNTKILNQYQGIVTIKVSIKTKEELSELMNKLNQLSVVDEIYRSK